MKCLKSTIISVLIVILCVCTSLSSAYALDGDGTSNGGGGSGTGTNGPYNVLYPGSANGQELGYRFSVMKKDVDGAYSQKGSIDVYKNGESYAVKTAYNHHFKVTINGDEYRNLSKYEYKNYLDSMTLDYETTVEGSSYNFAWDSTLGLTLPATVSGMTTWGLNENKLTPILERCGLSSGVADLTTDNYIMIEPIYGVYLNSTAYCITVTEMSVIG